MLVPTTPDRWPALARIGARQVLVLLATVFLGVNLVNAVRKGGDFDVYEDAARRLITGAPLYAGSVDGAGFVGPPVQALLFVPFVPLAAIHPAAARIAWFVVNALLLWQALTIWVRLLSRSEDTSDPPRTSALASRDGLLALAAVAYPLQTQFEHLNLNVVLLWLAALAADALTRNRPFPAGVALGFAAAIKVYPAIALPWLLARRAWRTLAAAVLTIAAVSLAPLLLRGVAGFADDLSSWRDIAGHGWPTRRANQSVLAMWARYHFEDGPAGYPDATWEATAVIALTALTAAVLTIPLLASAWRNTPRRSTEELACVGALGALLSPIAWEHYWMAWFPVLFALRLRAGEGSRMARYAFWAGAISITILSKPVVGWYGAQVVRAWSVMTWGGILTCAVLTACLLRESRGRTH